MVRSKSWRSLSISEDIISVIESKFGFTKITEIQKRSIPQFLAHKDVVAQAPTGSGKTLAFVIPILEILRRRSEPWKLWEVGALILAPNRELACQIADTIDVFLANIPDAFRLITFIGGTKLESDVKNFKKNGGNIIVATPGRLVDLLIRAHKDDFALSGHLKSLEILVLDEADRLLELGFQDSLSEILARLPKQRRTGLFSATQTEALDELAKTGLRNPLVITVYDTPTSAKAESSATSITPALLNNYYTIVPAEAKFTALKSFLRQHNNEKILVFLSTCACVDYFGELLTRSSKNKKKPTSQNQSILTLHGKKKRKRGQIFDQFRKRESGVLICTDIMARGIDIADIDWVIQYDPPRQASWFIHRCGRTARCGKSGNALMMLTPSEEGYLEFLQRNQNVALASMTIPFDDGQEWEEFERIRKQVSRSRELLEKGSKAFVSYIQAYSKHDCRIVCSLKELDAVNVAHCFGLFRLPKMPELAGRDLSGFLKSEIKTSDIPYEDKTRELQRQKRIEDSNPAESSKAPSVVRKPKSVDPHDRETAQIESIRKRKRNDRTDLDELDRDYKLVKKLKKGKVTKAMFDEHFFADA